MRETMTESITDRHWNLEKEGQKRQRHIESQRDLEPEIGSTRIMETKKDRDCEAWESATETKRFRDWDFDSDSFIDRDRLRNRVRDRSVYRDSYSGLET